MASMGNGAMASYVTYGLNVRSAIPLPELTPGRGAQDVTIRVGSVDCYPSVGGEGTPKIESAEEEYLFQSEVGAFLIRGGREIVIEPVPEVEERYLRLFILGPALAFLLLQRGRLPLHASTVSMEGEAVAFLGESGWGKSTMAAALHARGHGLVTDDVTAVEVRGGANRPLVYPGFPQIKLWPEAAASLGDKPETMPRLHSGLEKRARRATERYAQEPLPLKRVYVLAEGEVQEIVPLQAQQALMELTRHTYGGDLLQTLGRTAANFLHCAGVAKSVTVCSLRRRRSLAELPDLVRLVEGDVARSVDG